MPRESRAARAARTGEILRRLAEAYPESECSLVHENPFRLLVATVLSAQCTDARVNAATPALFARFPTPLALGDAPVEEVEELVRPLGFFRNKARAIIGLSQALVERHGGEVPRTMAELTSLPGVGRKTANVVLGVAFGHAEGVVVDTHVKRIAHRLGLTRHSGPEKIEADLLGLLPEEDRVIFTHRVIDHGRAICVARVPRCWECPLADICPSANFARPKPRARSRTGS
ncbi:MAG TPA: endonuclease III [Longimicrobiaceae bacterium]|nr:endonuclease III [Longimicrobiaceae bacterium]